MLNPKSRNYAKKKKCIAFMVESDMTQKEIADELNVSENTISSWKNDEEFIDEYITALKNSIKDIAPKAFQTVVKLLAANSEQVRLAAAKDVLDRAGFKPTDNVNVSGTLAAETAKLDELVKQMSDTS